MAGMRLQRHAHTRSDSSTVHHVHIEVDKAGNWVMTNYGVTCAITDTNAVIEPRATSLLVDSEDYIEADLTPITWLPDA